MAKYKKKSKSKVSIKKPGTTKNWMRPLAFSVACWGGYVAYPYFKAEYDPSDPVNTLTPWVWWAVVSLISLFNISMLVETLLDGAETLKDKKAISYRRWMQVAGTIYVLVCACRSIFPAAYLDRLCFWDTKIFVPIVQRSLAFTAEVCIAIQGASLGRFVLDNVKEWRYGTQPFKFRPHDQAKPESLGCCKAFFYHLASFFIGWVCVPALFLANVSCTTGSFIKDMKFYLVEESTWAVIMAIGGFFGAFLVWELAYVIPKKEVASDKNALRIGFFILNIVCIISAVGICAWDLPNMYAEMLEKPAPGIDIWDGIMDFMVCQKVSRRFEDTWYYMSWQGPYFTICVWSCLLMCSAPGAKLFERSTERLKSK